MNIVRKINLNQTTLLPERHRFRPLDSTLKKLFRITDHIYTWFEKRCHIGAVFIDISKAFHKVWHKNILIN